MKHCVRLAATLGSVLIAGSVYAADITGAGATFPYPLYAKWAANYKGSTGNNMNYQSIGSGGGIKQIQSKTVDFGASDMPLKPEELEKSGLTQFPTVMGGVVPVYNIPGVTAGQIKFTGALLADIYMGKVSKWNDAAIAKLNPGVKLPDQRISVVRRSDGSGTTFVFTNYLSKVSAEWAKEVGSNTSVSWKGSSVGGKGNEGVANYVSRIKGAIGYVEYAYAKQNKLAYGLLQNQAGDFVKPDAATFKAAANNADWKKAQGFYLILTNQPGKESWPITSATFILMHKKQDKPTQATEVLKYFDWAYKNGDKTAQELDYIPMPDNVKGVIRTSWKQITDGSGKPVWN
ncbi:phosphate ABC transporter substrate-binding protein PstS [Chromobacterium sp. IIBBL 290-4]|uniref:phosphate ABC transporter substrate-binding protein PstS n=1 Tax=Chromobacterium sp. IIBBL 290-4 TaxID=2953890 RepID=UPI0020B652D6|nr:phosphate ABC transporter substrate-binding protein PstS [Chromobacterium sp. IIBBL 290-4]UTH75124.1 phosphate ABC transporter substrate-binding protein PstS [Chromobacterium sp. IIBBL 290-4]